MTKFVFPAGIENSGDGAINEAGHPFIHIVLYDWQTYQKNTNTPQSKTKKIDEYFIALPETTIQEQYNHSWENGHDVSSLVNLGAGSTLKAVMGKIAKKFTPFETAKDIASFKTGILMNDFVAQNYSGLDFRRFEFLFNMIPRSSEEASIIFGIISSLRYYTTPKYTDVKVKFPAVVRFAVYSGVNNKALFYSDFCGIETLGMNYSPSGFMRTFKDGMPVQIHLNLSLKELRRFTPEEL